MLWLKPLLVQLQNYLATSVQSWQKEGFRKRTPIFRKKPRELKYQLKIVVVHDTTTESSEDEEEDVQKNNKTTRPLPSQNVDAMPLCADSTETEGDVTDTDNDPGWASLEEEIEATSADGGDDEKESKLRGLHKQSSPGVMAHGALCLLYADVHILQAPEKVYLPTILHYWETYKASLSTQLKKAKDVVWSADGWFDSMGHIAKYGAYTCTLFCSTVMKLFTLSFCRQIKQGAVMPWNWKVQNGAFFSCKV